MKGSRNIVITCSSIYFRILFDDAGMNKIGIGRIRFFILPFNISISIAQQSLYFVVVA